jgi:PAS domain S-box-containing protein
VVRSGDAARLLPRRVTLLVFLVLAAVSVVAFAATWHVAEDQEDRLLHEQAVEVQAVMAGQVAALESSLKVLGPVGAADGPQARALFRRTAGKQLGDATTAFGVAAVRQGRLTVVVGVGDGPAEGAPLNAARRALFQRALNQKTGKLVSGILKQDGQRRLVLAMKVEGTRAVVYRGAALDSARPVQSTQNSPFRGLEAALYAAPGAKPSNLIVKTEGDPLAGSPERLRVRVGADRWLLVVAERDPLAGTLASQFPWFVLAGGLVTAWLVALVVETLLRRRAWAMNMVLERTGDLELALDELSEAHAFVDRLMTALPVLVARFSLDHRQLTYVSPNVARMLGYTDVEALAPGFLKEHIDPEDLPEVTARFDRVATESVSHAVEFRFQRPDQVPLWLSTVIVPDLDEDGRLIGMFAYAWDVSAQRHAEQAQREAQAAAEAANRAKSEFLSRMSHELRTPLNSVLGFGQLLEIDYLSDTQRDAVGHILKGGRHLLGLINEVLDISRIETGDLRMSPESVRLSELIEEAISLMRPMVEQRGIKLVVDRPDESTGYVFADRQRAKQVLLNLLSNAVKYNRPKGTVVVSCARVSDDRVRISVADTGMGIPSDRLGMLFTPFERLGAEHGVEEGTGIGLALSKRLTEAMGGTLSMTTTQGQGSTFTVELPSAEGPVERYERLTLAPHYIPPVVTNGGRLVLHIEDNLSNLSLIERVFAQRPGVEVIAAMQGRLGIELARKHRPALVLLDLHLPDIGGEQVLQQLRDDPMTSSIPVVIVSADATSGQIQRLLNAGAAAYITKPIDVREVLRHLDEAVVAR